MCAALAVQYSTAMRVHPFLIAAFTALLSGALAAQGAARASQAPAPTPAPPAGPRGQNPSPMVERTRAHERLPLAYPAGHRATVDAGLGTPIDVFLPESVPRGAAVRVLVHFHGAAIVAAHAATRSATPTLSVTINLGSGSGVYERGLATAHVLDRIVQAALGEVDRAGNGPIALDHVVLSAFSAGYGGVRALARAGALSGRVRGVLLLDGLHAGYVPEGRPLADGGEVEMTELDPFVALARRAVAGDLALSITHSEVFPGTYASTTECTDALLAALGLTRAPVLKWGPGGMQQLSETSSGRFRVLGFAGNSAPDHVDHLHALPAWVDTLLH